MPFVRNAWYVAAFSEEVGSGLLARTIAGEPLILHRPENGTISALLDICPHRFAPLSMGTFVNGHIQCPYHGLEFDRAGTCVHNPHGNGARPKTLNLRSFTVVERDGLIWVWMGEARADTDAIPDFSARIDPARKNIGGHEAIACNYRLLIDNLMDLGHAQYVHRANSASDAFADLRRDVSVKNGSVTALMTYPNSTPTVFAKQFLDPNVERMDQWIDIDWFPVSAMRNFVGFGPTGSTKERSLNSIGTHIITPETEGSCHYFFGASRNFAIDEPKIDEAYRKWQAQALLSEDRPMVEAIERLIPAARNHQMKPALLSCDEAAVRVAKEIEKMLLTEAA